MEKIWNVEKKLTELIEADKGSRLNEYNAAVGKIEQAINQFCDACKITDNDSVGYSNGFVGKYVQISEIKEGLVEKAKYHLEKIRDSSETMNPKSIQARTLLQNLHRTFGTPEAPVSNYDSRLADSYGLRNNLLCGKDETNAQKIRDRTMTRTEFEELLNPEGPMCCGKDSGVIKALKEEHLKTLYADRQEAKQPGLLSKIASYIAK